MRVLAAVLLFASVACGSRSQLVLSDTASISVAVDADQIYWAGNQNIWRLTK